jgi:hypothetical protein
MFLYILVHIDFPVTFWYRERGVVRRLRSLRLPDIRTPLDLPDIDDFRDIVGSATKGDAVSMEQLRATFSRGPSFAAHVGSMGSRAKYTLIEIYTQGDPLQRAVIEKELDEIREGLITDEEPGVIEELLIGCVLCSYLELQVAMKLSQNLGSESVTLGRFHLKLRESATRRFNGAIRSLKLYRNR